MAPANRDSAGAFPIENPSSQYRSAGIVARLVFQCQEYPLVTIKEHTCKQYVILVVLAPAGPCSRWDPQREGCWEKELIRCAGEI